MGASYWISLDILQWTSQSLHTYITARPIQVQFPSALSPTLNGPGELVLLGHRYTMQQLGSETMTSVMKMMNRWWSKGNVVEHGLAEENEGNG